MNGLGLGWARVEFQVCMNILIGMRVLELLSAEPNCEMTHMLPRLSAKTKSSVPKGTPLTITYLNFQPKTPRSVRRRALKERYAFDCECSRCRAEESTEPNPVAAPPWLRWAHGNGAHYMIGAALAGAGCWGCALGALALYFFFWVHVCRYPI